MKQSVNLVRVSLKITGIVQGVGFRPTVYRYATERKLTGTVSNTSTGVFIEIEGPSEMTDSFMDCLKNNPPPLAKILTFETKLIEPLYEKEFLIIESDGAGEKDVLISPDLAICEDCKKEIFDPKNRRYLYPFTNCTNCGPRFSIIFDRPYDRKFTSMGKFKFCPDCKGEYTNPLDRRFHAEPNACPVCGPKLHFLGRKNTGDCLSQTIASLKEGKIVGVKSLGGFNIALDAFNLASVKRLRKIKDRPSKSFALMMKDLEVVKKYCELSAAEEKCLTSSRAPIVLLKKKLKQLDHLSPDNNYLGVMLPYTPLHLLLMQDFDCLVMTSLNKRDEPIVTSDEAALELIKEGVIDFALSNNRIIENRCDDSIVQFIHEKMILVRRARGFVPMPIFIESAEGQMMAYGADLKNTFAFLKNDSVYVSQHIGDLGDYRNVTFQEEEILKFKKLFGFIEEKKLTDYHPGFAHYHKTKNYVYHHQAHMLSVIAEHKLNPNEVLGVICDGTGLGPDGNIWGFEFLHLNKRLLHLEYFSLPGGEKAIFEVERIAVALTKHTNLYKDHPARFLLEKNIHCPLTSSLGRLFDGVAVLIGLIKNVSYEAEAAILLQTCAENCGELIADSYPVVIEDDVIKYGPMIDALLVDLSSKVSAPVMAYKFHEWIVNAIVGGVDLCQFKTVVLSGGCYQNVLLTKLLFEKLTSKNIKFYINELVPPNDAGISLGQILGGKLCV